MVRKTAKAVGAAALALAMVVAAAGSAQAVDPPRWVAALYVDAQKMIGLRWGPVPGATGYKVLRSTEAGKDYQEIGSTAAPQHFDKDIEPGTTYFYVLQAVAGAEASPNSDEKSVDVPGEKKVKSVLAPQWKAITQQQVTEFGKVSFKVGLTWEKSASRNVMAYNIYRSTTPGKDYQLVGSVPQTQFVDATGEEGKTYYYVLSATDTSFQETPFSPEKSVTLTVEKKAAVEKKKSETLEVVVKKTKLIMTVPLPEEPPLKGLTNFTTHPDEQEVFAIDHVSRQIVVFSEDGERLRVFGEQGFGVGQFAGPNTINIDNDGNLIISDSGRRMIMTFRPDGTFVREFSVAKKKLKPEDKSDPVPTGVAMTKDGGYIVVDNANAHLLHYDEDGELLGGWGEQASKKDNGLGFISAPGGIDIDSQGRIFLQDYASSRIQVFDSEGNALYTIGEGVKGLVGAFVKVGIPLVDEKRKVVWGLDNAMGNIQAFGLEAGDYLFTLTNEKGDLAYNERAEWDLSSTRSIGIDSRGRYWVMQSLPKRFAVLEIPE